MRKWLVDQARDQTMRFLLACHFRLYDRSDGKFYTGVSNSLKKLAEGEWKLTGGGINYLNRLFLPNYWRSKLDESIDISNAPRKTFDVFDTMASLAEQRSLEDAVTDFPSLYKTYKNNTLFYFTTLDRALSPLMTLYNLIGAGYRLANFTSLLGFTTQTSHLAFEDGEEKLLKEMGMMFGVFTSKRDLNTTTSNLKLSTTCKRPQTEKNYEKELNFYKELADQFPDLEEQLNAPDPLLVAHDLRAMNKSNRYAGRENTTINLFVNNIAYTKSGYEGNLDLNELYARHEKCYLVLKENIKEAYKRSPTFRRLFNYAYDNRLHNRSERWDMMPLTEERVGSGKERLTELYADQENLRREQLYYQSGPCLVPFSTERAYMHEVIKALTLLSNNVTETHPRGPVVEYTNIILKEMNLATPVRTRYIVNVPDTQLAIIKGRQCVNYAVYLQLRNNVTSSIPNFTKIAHQVMRTKIKEQTGLDLNPDNVYLNYFGGEAPKKYSPQAFLKWTRDVQPQWSVTLTDLAFCNFNNEDVFREANKLDEEYGVYWQGAGCGDYYGGENEVKIKPSQLRDIVWKLDFSSLINARLHEFWDRHQENWRTLSKAEFFRAALEAKEKGVLSTDDYTYILRGLDPGVPLNETVTLAHFQRKSPPSIDVRRLDINGYAATDILRFVLENKREVLYIPGSPLSFYVFQNDHTMRQWIVEQAVDIRKRFFLTSHFSAYDRQDGNSYTGVDNALQKLAEGDWEVDGGGIDYYDSFRIKNTDVFEALALQTKERRFQDADTLIMSDSELCEQRVLVAFQIAGTVLGVPLMLFGPIGALVNTLMFGAILGLEIHVASNGDSEEERQQALSGAEADVEMAVLFGAVTTVASPLIKTTVLRKIFNRNNKYFKAPQVINGKFGYLLGPEKPPQISFREKGFKISKDIPARSVTATKSLVGTENLVNPSATPQIESKKLPTKQVSLLSVNNRKSLVTKIEVRNFYEQLYRDCPELETQLKYPDPLLLLHDEVATDTSYRLYKILIPDLVMLFIKSSDEIHYFNNPKILLNEWKVAPYEFNLLKRIINEVYSWSPTFRRLFNYAYDSELQDPEKRWLIAPREAFSTTVTEEELMTANGVRTIGLNVDFISRRYYESDIGPVPFTAEHAYLNEIIKALTGIHFTSSEFYFRGPIVEYANIILKEVGRELPDYRVPLRTRLVTSLSDEQLEAIYHYKTLAITYPELQIQTQNPDPFLLDHDRVAFDSSDKASHSNFRVSEMMFKQVTKTFNSINSPLKLAKGIEVYNYIAALLEEAYAASPTFRRLFNRAILNYNWRYARNRVTLVTNSEETSTTLFFHLGTK
ncbi:hypothetical protein Zmor_008714 [Zophobas morio]|uniref:Dermonecrotic toxin N-terminal domain-containing protein n=1 Tax=Zophobas morio TaxID=2755281 RepID=A0AA38HJK0_9CUCU|nr:hypothetical protein Zmor_008714 [Zophobas morio]